MNRLIILVMGILVVGGLAIVLTRKSTQPITKSTGLPTAPSATSQSQNNSVAPLTTQTGLNLELPFDFSKVTIPPKSFGIYPFGIVSSEHPEGHGGFNFELARTVQIVAPAGITIASITSPSGRPDEHNIIAHLSDSHSLEFLRVGTLAATIKIGSILKQGDALAWPAHNNSLNVDMFHMGLLDSGDNAVCPDQSFWQAAAWDQLNQILKSSKDDHGKPYTQLCYSTHAIPRSKRLSE